MSGLLYKTRSPLNDSMALMLFKALIIPLFDYGCLLYEVVPEYQLKWLQVIQNATGRLILSEQPDARIYQLHKHLHHDSLATRRLKTMVKVPYLCLLVKEPYICMIN